MKPFRKTIAVVALAGAAATAWFGTNSLVRDVHFAQAAEDVAVTRQQLQNVQDLSTVFRQVAKVVEPSVVMIEVKKTVHGVHANIPDDLLRRFFPDRDGDGAPDMPDEGGSDALQVGEGSGVIMEADGKTAYVLTNNHVAGGASEMHVTLSDGRVIDNATLVGADPKSDLAVVKMTIDHIVPAKWGNSDYLEKGDMILAFGSPFGYVGSMTHGIVSALNRDALGIIGSEFRYENFIQVDAPINPGNSGGPLVNLHGEVVGINTAIASRTGAFNGIGFAIPSNLAKPVYDQLKEKGKVTRGYLGVKIGNVDDPNVHDKVKSVGYTGTTGIYVDTVYNDTPSVGKLEPGDVITAINSKEVNTVTQLRSQIANIPPGNDVKLTVFREGKTQEVTLKVGEQPEDMLSRASMHNGTNRPNSEGATTASALGIRLATPSDDQLQRYELGDSQGALVTGVEGNSPAAAAGVRAGDLITRIENQTVKSAAEAESALQKQDLKKGVRLYVTNKEGERFVFIKNRTK